MTLKPSPNVIQVSTANNPVDPPSSQQTLGARLPRRSILAGIGASMATVPLAALVGCGGVQNQGQGGTAGMGGTGGSGGIGGTGGSGGMGGTGASSGTSGSTSTGTNVVWATGGTASMSGDYTDPFTTDPGPACALTCALTLGPCYADTVDRKDISEGYQGLPVRLALRVVDDACNPVEGASVDIWHTRNSGLYSGPDASNFCTSGDPDAKTHQYFRGVQSTDADGRVDFDTCFPGWYASRAIHIHFTVRVGGSEYVTSQLFFPQALIVEIFAIHPDYKGFGQPDTPNAADKIYAGAEYELAAQKQADGALLAWKTLVIRSSLTDKLCAAG